MINMAELATKGGAEDKYITKLNTQTGVDDRYVGGKCTERC